MSDCACKYNRAFLLQPEPIGISRPSAGFFPLNYFFVNLVPQISQRKCFKSEWESRCELSSSDLAKDDWQMSHFHVDVLVSKSNSTDIAWSITFKADAPAGLVAFWTVFFLLLVFHLAHFADGTTPSPSLSFSSWNIIKFGQGLLCMQLFVVFLEKILCNTDNLKRIQL